MDQLISFPGLKFSFVKLEGVFKFKHFRNGKLVLEHEFTDKDFEGLSAEKDAKNVFTRGSSGKEISAVGLKVILIMNDGTFDVEFRGDSGSRAVCVLDGLEERSQKPMQATASTQTKIQTDVSQVDVNKLQEELEILRSQLKPDASEDWNDAWPRYIFLSGKKLGGKVRSDIIVLRIDRKMGVVQRKEIASDGNRVVEEIIKLSDPKLNVRHDAQDRVLKLTLPANKKKKSEEPVVRFGLRYAANPKMWATNDKSKENEFPFYDVEVVVEELTTCIDKALGRKCSILNPKTKQPYSLEPRNSKRVSPAEDNEDIEQRASKRHQAERFGEPPPNSNKNHSNSAAHELTVDVKTEHNEITPNAITNTGLEGYGETLEIASAENDISDQGNAQPDIINQACFGN